MVVALRADLIITLDFFAVDDFSAVITLEPHPFRNLGSFRGFRLGRFVFFKTSPGALLLGRHKTAAPHLSLRRPEYHSHRHDARRFPIEEADSEGVRTADHRRRSEASW
jgi:hypothetical protein